MAVEVVVTGLADLKKQLKAAKDEMIALSNATMIDPQKLQDATDKAGQLTDMLGDANAQIKIMSGGSGFEKISSGLGVMKDQLMNMDFEGAAETAKGLTKTIKDMDPKKVQAAFKAFSGTILELGKQFVSLGVKLLMNPIFLIPALIIGLVMLFISFKDKVKVLGDFFDLLMKPIEAIIQAFKDLTDAIHLTTNAQDEMAEKGLKNTNKRVAGIKYGLEQEDKAYARDLAMKKSRGEDTTAMEAKHAADRQNSSKKLVDILDKQIAVQKVAVANASKEEKKQKQDDLNALIEDRREQVDVNKNSANEIGVIRNNHNKDLAAKQKTANEKANTDAEKHRAEVIAAERRGLEVERAIANSRIAGIEDIYTRELAMSEEKRKEQEEDLKYTEYTEKQKADLTKVYAEQKAQSDKKSLDDDTKRKADKVKEDEAIAKQKIDDQKAFDEKLLGLQNEYEDDVIESGKDELAKTLNTIKRGKEARLKSEDERYELEKEKAKGNQKELERLEEEHIARMKAIKDDADVKSTEATTASNEKEIQIKKDRGLYIAEQAMQLASGLADALNSIDEGRLNKIDANHSAEISMIDAKRQQELAVIGLTEEQKKAINQKADKAKYDADVRAWQATEKIKKEQFVRDKAMRMVSIVMDTATAVMKGFGEAGPIAGAILSAATIAMGAMQLGIVATQKYQGSPGPAAPAIGSAGGSPSSEALTPTWTPTKRSEDNTTGMAASATAPSNIVVTAIVSETDMTNTQSRVSKMQKSAEL